MMTKLILKILFKATLPLVAVVGIASYALYAAGGDPLSILKRVSGGFGQQLAVLADSAGSSIDSVRDKASSGLSAAGSDKNETLYRWKDAQGVTHFSNTLPEDSQQVQMITVDPNQNLMSAPRRQVQAAAKRTHRATGQFAGDEESPEPMPGIAGVFSRFSNQQSNQDGNQGSEMSSEQSTNPADLIEQYKKIQQNRQAQIP